ncbi:MULTISPECIES: adenylyltransferase/cytidyltransferase family protein [Vibrio]|uniref:Glycerol-3-phosphate cytidylyltransferase n=1 Tax=Vibrio lentus TaxID=136468 RepID=A0A2N7BRG7_9VIBR|nr:MULTISPECIES: adenylyltransferase/cytidyltransferase family protein [Vibrio]NAZ54547.1 adenylyltransferase/cytidyltransferase family protein [Vibrio toranzoniae]OEE90335.1 glycerol-3-phosphate cytidylyltransferase [Vibrio crassostreae 9ZC88]PME54133.1 glycerol-3-phosphate cytidylyltransferase [Vibrio lentus]PME61725.1 glycerol-3-phosphate cytidylyltransferase [Vibrio lentus]PME80337.1 glycerol-3-phosphate cytidylyltransferase [Vibrio lentus]
MRVITFGTFDVFHIGHVNILERAKEFGEHLIVGVSTDALNFSKKQRFPIYNENSRAQIVSAIHCVDQVFFEHSLELKRQYILEHKADVLVMGDDWEGKFDEFSDICKVVYLPRTADVSTTEIIKTVRDHSE